VLEKRPQEPYKRDWTVNLEFTHRDLQYANEANQLIAKIKAL